MKKVILFIAMAVVTCTFFSCIDEDGAGVPMPKELFVEHSNAGDTVVFNVAKGEAYKLRWIAIDNAKYEVSLKNPQNEYVYEVKGTPVDGPLGTLNMDIPCATITEYASNAAVVSGEEQPVTPFDIIYINVTAKPENPQLPCTAPETGKSLFATVKLVDTL